jgi:hypothetical protein
VKCKETAILNSKFDGSETLASREQLIKKY